MTPLQRRQERKSRNQTGLDMNLVSLIDIFTILIFFLLSATGVEVLSAGQAVKLPPSTAEKAPRETVVVTVSREDILVEGRAVAKVAEVLASPGDLIEPLKAELVLLQKNRQVLRADNAAASKAVTIMGDKDIPYRLLRKVMATAAQADYADVAFAVAQKVGKS